MNQLRQSLKLDIDEMNDEMKILGIPNSSYTDRSNMPEQTSAEQYDSGAYNSGNYMTGG